MATTDWTCFYIGFFLGFFAASLLTVALLVWAHVKALADRDRQGHF
ncbi:hypothetical protein GR212_15500 [Rhizobium lusitanum]|uniref:Uncharacterized protein n=1 Tax=Rhizobium lusitanum TaxID=293958 RepID=A0A6L9U4W3_9HYPH|nr:hypothetical protein [Rhizobium lusitanum]NEI70985.1 hypothetical protein [Rhizobium lusitanum]